MSEKRQWPRPVKGRSRREMRYSTISAPLVAVLKNTPDTGPPLGEICARIIDRLAREVRRRPQ